MYSFTFERLTVGDLWTLIAIKLRGCQEADALTFLDMMRRAFDGDVSSLSIAEHSAVMQAFSSQFSVFLQDLNAPHEASPDLMIFRRLFQ